MKKSLLFLLPIFALNLFNLSSCESKDNRVLLSFGDVHAKTYKEINTDDLTSIVTKKESFLLVVNTTTCGCWDNFKPNLTRFIEEEKLICYQISFNELRVLEAKDRFGLTSLSSSTTTFAIFENGTLKTSINSTDHENIMYDYKSFKQYMSETVRLPKCFFISKEDVSTIKSSGKKAIIYFERSGCDDCNALNPTILYSYIKNHNKMNNIYVLDCQPYWRASSDEDFSTYQTFKDDMGLSTTTNPTYGYGTGVFPFFSYIENGEYKSGSVIYNDVITSENDKFFVSESYYTSEMVSKLDYKAEVLEGLEIPSDEILLNALGKPSWKLESQNRHYQAILDSFLNAKLPKVNFEF